MSREGFGLDADIISISAACRCPEKFCCCLSKCEFLPLHVKTVLLWCGSTKPLELLWELIVILIVDSFFFWKAVLETVRLCCAFISGQYCLFFLVPFVSNRQSKRITGENYKHTRRAKNIRHANACLKKYKNNNSMQYIQRWWHHIAIILLPRA